jgi:hypothetical protein
MHADFDLAEDGTVRSSTHGGARAGAGSKPTGFEKPVAVHDYDVARARKEAALADQHELAYKIKSGEYVARAAVRQASATTMANLAQTMRSVSDNLERRGVPPAVCAQVDAAINAALSDASGDLEMMSGADQ